jgi:hypothetical protein
MGNQVSKKTDKSSPILSPNRLQEGEYYKQIFGGKSETVSKCKRLTRKTKGKNCYILKFDKEIIANCTRLNKLSRTLRFKKCINK